VYLRAAQLTDAGIKLTSADIIGTSAFVTPDSLKKDTGVEGHELKLIVKLDFSSSYLSFKALGNRCVLPGVNLWCIWGKPGVNLGST
jgi:hypothetical protein